MKVISSIIVVLCFSAFGYGQQANTAKSARPQPVQQVTEEAPAGDSTFVTSQKRISRPQVIPSPVTEPVPDETKPVVTSGRKKP